MPSIISEPLDDGTDHFQPSTVQIASVDADNSASNVIPGKVVFTIDIRSPDKATLDEMDDRIRDGIDTICDALQISGEVEQVGHFDPVTFDEGCVSKVRDAAERLGYSHRNIVSGAGHDACWVNRVAPTSMIMCPCVDGLSHNEDEKIFPEWATAGTDVLLHAVLESAEIES